eukprot:scaffold167896_cov30-Tisochrysis_lutea.AAC.3
MWMTLMLHTPFVDSEYTCVHRGAAGIAPLTLTAKQGCLSLLAARAHGCACVPTSPILSNRGQHTESR